MMTGALADTDFFIDSTSSAPHSEPREEGRGSAIAAFGQGNGQDMQALEEFTLFPKFST
jgi:hypothetical protein